MTVTTPHDRLDITELLADDICTDRSDRLGDRLTDARQDFLAAVRECVERRDSDSLTALCEGSHAVHKILALTATSLTRFDDLDGNPFKSGDVAPVHAARALAALGLALVSGPDQASAHFRCFRRWIARSGLEVPGEPVRRVPAAVDSPNVSVMRSLADTGELDVLSLVWMTELDGWLRRGRWSTARSGPSTPVLLDRGPHGQRALLSVSRVPGLPVGFVPDPATMTLCSADASFGLSLATAWKAAGGSSRGTVMWSLGDKAEPVTRVAGESLGVGLAVLVKELRRQSRPLRGPLTVRRLRPHTAIVGRIDPTTPRATSSVSGYEAKLGVADEKMRVVLPYVDRTPAAEANHKYGDNAQLILVRTWRGAARAARSVDRRRAFKIAAAAFLALAVAVVGLYRLSEVRHATTARQAAADAAARTVLDRSTDNLWERLHLDLRAYRTSDTLASRDRIRAWARQLEFAQVMLPVPRQSAGAVVNADGSAAVVPDPDDEERLLAWDLAASPPRTFPLDAGAAAPPVVAWLGRDVVAVSRPSGKTSLWNVRTGRLLRQLDAGGDVLFGDPMGRWLGYGTSGTDEVHVVDLAGDTAETVRLPGELYPQIPRESALPRVVAVKGILTSGELVVVYDGTAVALSRTGSRRLDDRAYQAKVVDLGQGQAVVERCVDGMYELFGVESSTVLASFVEPDSSCSTSPVFTSDLQQPIVVEAFDMTGRGEPMSYVVLGTDTDDAPARRVEIPVGHRLIRAARETSGTYRLVLGSSDTLLVLRVPPLDPMEEALIDAEYAVVTTAGRYLVLRYEDDSVECWDIATRTLKGAAPRGSADFSQTGASGSLVLSPDGGILVTVHHDGPAGLWRLPDLHPLGEISLPAVSPAFSSPDPVFPTVSFVTDRLLLVQRGDGFSTWNATPVAKLTEARISLPETDAPGQWHMVLPDLGQLVTVLGNHVQRNGLSDGALVPGSAFTLGQTPSRDFQLTRPVLNSDGSLMAVFHEDALEIWDIFQHRRIAREFLADGTVVHDIRFGSDSSVVEFVLMNYESNNAVGIFPQRWRRSDGVDVLAWLRLRTTGVEQAPDTIMPPVFAWPGAHGGLESSSPQSWLRQICRSLPNLRYGDELGLPDASWHGPVCRDR